MALCRNGVCFVFVNGEMSGVEQSDNRVCKLIHYSVIAVLRVAPAKAKMVYNS